MTLMQIRGLSLSRGGTPVLRDIDLTVAAGEVVGLIGPNGAGKTTLLRAAMGLLPARGDASLAALAPAARARHAAYLPQSREIAWPMTVRAVVGLGRIPHPGTSGPRDRAAIDAALAALALSDLADRCATTLSGGQQARVLIARALAQDTPLLIADEPTAGLDPAAAIRVMVLMARLAADGRGVVASLHDLGLAARHCTRLVVLDGGRIVADGPPLQVLTPDLLAGVFGITAHLATGPDGPVFQPLTARP